jgi:phosphate transport system substrate-binding protein
MALIECQNCDEGVYAKPSQQTITFKQYPLVRGLYYVLKENYAGIGSRFINFLSTERGQLIFRRALLVPTKISFDRRRTNITEQ